MISSVVAPDPMINMRVVASREFWAFVYFFLCGNGLCQLVKYPLLFSCSCVWVQCQEEVVTAALLLTYEKWCFFILNYVEAFQSSTGLQSQLRKKYPWWSYPTHIGVFCITCFRKESLQTPPWQRWLGRWERWGRARPGTPSGPP